METTGSKMENRSGWKQSDYIALCLLLLGLLLLITTEAWLSGLATLFCAFFCWTRVFEHNKARGNRTLGTLGRIAGAGISGTFAILLLLSRFGSEPNLAADKMEAPSKMSALSADESSALEKRNKIKIAELIAAEKELAKGDYEGRVVFWQQITALAPGNSDYANKLDAAKRRVAELSFATQNPEQAMQVEKVEGRMEGFGNVLVIDITLRNDSLSNLKDFHLKCDSKGPSGTKLGVNSTVLYETVNARETRTFRKVNMGLLNYQATSTYCEVLQSSIG